mmetsp:Transcript_334/g.795  ORF Transcript_334/g.795 Transcript_334/m.795 type:complete len:1201 (-) Transcript_334:141-3743(-)
MTSAVAIPAAEADIAREKAIEDAKVEQLLSEKLMNGYVLMEATCPNPNCALPLVKNNKAVPRNLSRDENDPVVGNIDNPVVVPSKSFEQPFKPVDGVPVCVGCNSHVITQELELAILEESDALTDKGSVYVALQAQHPQKSEQVIQEAATDPSTIIPEEQDGNDPEIINLEDVTEDDVLVGSHRQKFVVDIAATSYDMDGVSNVEMMMSPRAGDPEKPIDVEDLQGEKEETEDPLEELSVRREIATKVLGAKMLQGWTLKEKTCESCAMPLMEHKGKEDCPVCPVLAKRAKKKLKQQKRIEAEKTKLQQKVDEKKDAVAVQQNLVEQVQEFEEIQKVRGEIEIKAIQEDEDATRRAEERKRIIEEEKEILVKMQEVQQKMNDRENAMQQRVLEEELASQIEIKEDSDAIGVEASLVSDAIEDEASPVETKVDASPEQETAVSSAIEFTASQERASKIELERLEAITKEEEKRRIIKAEMREKEEQLALEEAKKKALQETAAQKLAEEATAIEAFDESTMADDKTEAMKKDRLVEEHRKNIADKIAIDEQVAKLEEERIAEAMEARRLAEERRIQSECRMIAALEADAALKALAAEEAIQRAKEALKEVTSTKKYIISQTIELAEKEAVAETEDTLKARHEEHSEPVVLKTKSEIYMERWETLRLESRAIMTRRILQGWVITSEACVVEECHNSPLIEMNGKKECTVCGGCGDGKDVVSLTQIAEVETLPAAPEPKSVVAPVATAQEEEKPATPELISVVTPVTTAQEEEKPALVQMSGEEFSTLTAMEEDLEKNRQKYIQMISRKLIEGWALSGSTCDTCVMPLVMDEDATKELCIACGVEKQLKQQERQHTFDASTIATKDMAALEINEEDEPGPPVRPLSPVVESIATKDVEIERESPTLDSNHSPSSDDSDLVSTIQRQAQKQQPKRKPVVTADPPAFKPTLIGGYHQIDVIQEEVIALPPQVDFADAAAIRELIGSDLAEEQDRDDTDKDASIDTVANLFLKSPHGYDFKDIGKSMDVEQVQDLVDIFLVTNVDRDVSESFKLAVAERILEKMSFASRQQTSPLASYRRNVSDNQRRFNFDDTATKPKARGPPFPEAGGSPRKMVSPRSRQVHVIGGPSPTARYGGMRSPREEGSVISRASTVASEALDSIYYRIDLCKKKLLDPSNNLDEQIATAALLEKLAQAAVAVREMETFE